MKNLLAALIIIVGTVCWNVSFTHALAVLTVPQGGTGAASFTTGECLKGNGTGPFTTGTCGGGASSGISFSADTNYGQQVYSTSTPTLWFKNGLFASSTSQIAYASTTALSTSGNAYVGGTLNVTGNSSSSGQFLGAIHATVPAYSFTGGTAYGFGYKTSFGPAIFDGNGGQVGLTGSVPSAIELRSGGQFEWSSTAALTGTTDTNLSRLSAGVIGFGTGAAASTAGSFIAASSTISSGLFTMSGGASTTQITSTGSSYFATSGGFVGIGTAAPAYKFDSQGGTTRIVQSLAGTGYAAGPYALSLQSNTSSTWLEILDNGGANKGVFFGIAGNEFQMFNWQGGGIQFYTAPSASSGALRMTILNNGNVGIGTSTPLGTLHVLGTTVIDGVARLLTTAGATTNATDLAIYTVTNGTPIFALADWNTGTKGLFINTSTGSVGIGSTTPGTLLSIGGSGTGWNFLDNATTTKNGVGGIDIKQGCFSINGVCVSGGAGGGGSGAVGSGTTGQLPYYASSGTTLTATSSIFLNTTTSFLGIGTTTPQWAAQISTASAPQLTLTDPTGGGTHWSFWNRLGNLFLATSSPTTFATSTNSLPYRGYIEFPATGGCVGCSDLVLPNGVNLINANYGTATTSAVTADTFQDVYTVPAGRKAFLTGSLMWNNTAGTVGYALFYKNAGSYYQITATTSPTTLNRGDGVGLFVLDPGETVAVRVNTTTASAPVWLNYIEFDSSVPFKTLKSLAPTNATTTLYTVPANTTAVLLPTNLNYMSPTSSGLAITNNTSSAITQKVCLVKSGQIAQNGLNCINAGTGTIAANTAGSVPYSSSGMMLNSGDSVQFVLGTSLVGTNSIVWQTVSEH